MTSPVKIWRNQKKLQKLVGKTGKIISYTLVRVAPTHWKEQAPYPVAVVLLSDGSRITAKVVDYEEKHMKIHQKVVTVVRRIRKPSREGIIPYGIKVKPV